MLECHYVQAKTSGQITNYENDIGQSCNKTYD